MFLLISLTFLTGLFGFAFPPLWIATFLLLRAIVRFGRENHRLAYEADELERIKVYKAWS